MECRRCGTESRPGRRFCARCGAPLTLACTGCGFANEATDEFCGGCGQPLTPIAIDSPRSPPATPRVVETPPSAGIAERRQLTVMFCDLVGSTALAARLDPEDLRDHVRAYQAASAEIITRFDGHIAQYLGDGLLVYFGYPVAHEDDAQRAIRTALAIVAAIEALNAGQPGGVQLAVRVGIHTGLVVVGEVGGGDRREQLALGETPNIAARLQALADPDAVVISAATYRLVGRIFACRELGDRILRGTTTPQALYRVLGERGATRLDAFAPPALTSLVGREREVGVVLQRWETAAEGFGQVVLLSGEAGIGKTRLAHTVCERAEGLPHRRLDGRCSPYRQHSAMYLFVELLQQALGFEREDTVERLLQRLEGAVAEAGLPPAEGMPLLASLLAVPAGSQYPPLAWSPLRQKQRTIEIILEILRGLATRRPLFVFLEDLHWADASSLEVLSTLVDQIATAPIFVLLTARPDFRPPWAVRSHTTQVVISRLPRRQTEEMILRVGGGRTLPREVLQQLVDGADGVPLFVEELTRMVLESGLLREQADRYELDGPIGPLRIPMTLHDSLMARLDRLTSAKPVAQMASAIGREFSYELLRVVSSMDEGSLQRDLALLVEAELLYQRGLPPTAHYTFKHALIQEAAYQSLLRSTRREYHQRIAGALAATSPETRERHPELLAHHLTEAGLAAEAIPLWREAGNNAVRRSANAEAVVHFERGLALVSSLTDGSERDRVELSLLMALGPSLYFSRGFAAPETGRVYARAQELCDRLGDSPEVFPALWGRWGFFSYQGQLEKALEVGKQLLGLARRAGDEALVLEAHHAMWPSRYHLGEPVAALEHFEAGRQIYDPARHHVLTYRYGGHDPGVCGLMFEALTRWLLGETEVATTRARQALELAKQLDHPPSTAVAFLWVVILQLLQGDAEAARRQAEGAHRLSAEYGFPQWAAMSSVLGGSARARLGDVEAGLVEMRRGLADWQATQSGLYGPMFLAFIADAELVRGDAHAGLVAVDEALRWVAAHGERTFEAELHRLRGELLLLRGTAAVVPDAEACFTRAIDVARHQHTKALELRAASSLAHLRSRTGRSDEAG